MPKSTYSAFALDQFPIPQNNLPCFVVFIHTNATVLNLKPHCSNVCMPTSSNGAVTHKTNAQLSSVILAILRFCISRIFITGYLYTDPRCPALARSRYFQGGSA